MSNNNKHVPFIIGIHVVTVSKGDGMNWDLTIQDPNSRKDSVPHTNPLRLITFIIGFVLNLVFRLGIEYYVLFR